MNNLKPIMKEKVIGGTPSGVNMEGGSLGKGLLKKKPFGKTAAAPKPMPNLMQRLTGK